MATNIVFTAEKTEISEQESFSIRRTGWDTWDASLPWETLSDCTMTLTAAFSSPAGSISRGIYFQVHNVVGSYRPTSRLQWLDANGEEYILSIHTDELPLLAAVLADLANDEGLPLDLDASELTPIKPGSRFDNQLADAVKDEDTEFAQAVSDGSPVQSVNGQQGVVVLNASSVGAVGKGDLVINASDYPDVQSALNAGARGARYFFPPEMSPIAVPVGGFQPKYDDITIDAMGVEFQIADWGTPAFLGLLSNPGGASGVTYRIGKVKYIGVRGTHAGSSLRGSALYCSGCAVWTNGDRNYVEFLRTEGMPTPVFFSSWNGTSSTDRQGVNNRIGNVHVEGFDFGVLWAGQKNLVIENLSGYGDIDDSAGVNPTHLIYGSATHGFRDSGVRIISAYAENVTHGHAYSWKYSDNLEANISAHACTGLLAAIDSHDMKVEGRITQSAEITVVGADAAVYISSTNLRSQRPVLSLDVQLAAGVNDRTHLIICDDGDLTLRGRSTHATGWNVSLGEMNIRGDRNRLIRPNCIQTGMPSGVGILLQGALNTFVDSPVVKGATVGVSGISTSSAVVVRTAEAQSITSYFTTTDSTSSIVLKGIGAPLTPYDFGAVPPIAGSDNTTALTAMFAAANSGIYAPSVYIPEGIWIAKGAAFTSWNMTNGLTVRGAGRSRTRLALSTGATVPMFQWNANISGVSFSDMWIESVTSIWEPASGGGLYGSSFRNLFLNATLATSRIYYQANSSSFIHNTFDTVEMQRLATGTVIPFHIIDSGGAANFNLFSQVRMNGYNNPNTPFLMIETTMPSTYLTDWTFINILGEQNPAGLIHSKAAYNWTLINVTDEDSTIQYNNDIIRFDANASGLAPRDITIMNSGRRGQSMAAGKYEIYVHPQAASGILIQNCNPTPVSGTAKISAPLYADIRGTRGYPQQLQGAGTPEGFVNAVVGSTYFRTDGAAGTSFYVKESGVAQTGWVAK